MQLLSSLHELGTENSRLLPFHLAVQTMPNANEHHISCLLRTTGLPKLTTSSMTCAGRTVITPAENKLTL